jgi:hypothetical protein
VVAGRAAAGLELTWGDPALRNHPCIAMLAFEPHRVALAGSLKKMHEGIE